MPPWREPAQTGFDTKNHPIVHCELVHFLNSKNQKNSFIFYARFCMVKGCV